MSKALFVSFQDFHGVYDGGSQANRRNVEVAKQILGDSNVDCFFVNDIKKKRSLLSLLYTVLLFPFGYFNGLTPSKVKTIMAISRKYDYIYINTSIFGIISKKLKEYGYHGKVINFFHNVESIYYESRVSKKLPFRNVIIGCAAKNDEYSLKYSDISIGLCQRDSDIVKTLYGKPFDVLAPISFADKCSDIVMDKEKYTGRKPKCYFIGSNFPANSEGLLWFVNNVLPHVDIDFQIIGKDMDLLKDSHQCLADIQVHTNVPDLAPYYIEADFMIFPIFSGSGMKVKTCEALMYGKNILGTSETFEGYELDTKKCGRLCNTAEEYINAINELCEKPVLRYNCYSRSVYDSKYSEKSAKKVFARIFGRSSYS